MMNLEQYFIFSSYAMFMTGYVMLASTRQLDVFSLGLFAVVLGAGWLIDSGRLSWSLGLRSANWLMAGGLVFLVAEWYALRVSPITVILHFVFFAAALRLLRRKSSRDWIWLYVVTFCQVLMTAGMMVSTTFLLLVIVYLFAARYALDTRLKRKIERLQKRQHRGPFLKVNARQVSRFDSHVRDRYDLRACQQIQLIIIPALVDERLRNFDRRNDLLYAVRKHLAKCEVGC